MQISNKDQHRLNLLREEGKKVYLAAVSTKKAVMDGEFALAMGMTVRNPEWLAKALKRRLKIELDCYKRSLFAMLRTQEQGGEVCASTIMRFLGLTNIAPH